MSPCLLLAAAEKLRGRCGTGCKDVRTSAKGGAWEVTTVIRLPFRCVHVGAFAALLALALAGGDVFAADVRATPEGGYQPPGPGLAVSIPLCPVTLPNGSVPPPGG